MDSQQKPDMYQGASHHHPPSPSSSRSHHRPVNGHAAQPFPASNFDILDWHPAYQSCQQYFLDHAQHEPGTQALCALINIRLPFQWLSNPLRSAGQTPSPQQSNHSGFNFNSWPRPAPSPSNHNDQQTGGAPIFVSLVPYVRRLVITGFDKPGILHGFFGDAWVAGVTPLQDCERRNYLFAAKHGGWRSCKKQYDESPEETVPFMKPLQDVRQEELEAAEKSWSSWLAMEDWMIGPRAPKEERSDLEMYRSGIHNAFDTLQPDGLPE